MTDEQTAAQLVSFGQCSTDAEFEAAIVRALQAARKECMDADDVDLVAPTPEVVSTFRTKAPPGHIIDDAGVVRKVLGTLPVTKDGCVVGDGAVLYFPWTLACGRKSVVRAAYRKSICLDPDAYTDRRAGYSTREAAEAAKESQ